MLNIEDLIRQIIASPLFKDELQTQVKWCMEDKEVPPQQTSDSVSLPQLVEEINGYITQITEIALEEENSKNYFAFMKKNEDFSKELEKKMNARIQTSVQQLDSKIHKMTLRLNEIAKSSKRPVAEGYKLKDERKMITQSILETSRLQNASSTFTNLHHTKSQVHFAKETNSYEELPQNNETNSSLSMELEKNRFGEIQKQCKKSLQAWWAKVQAALEVFKKRHEQLKEECTKLSEKAEMKLDGNLESLWNVISDLCSRISKFESMENLCQLGQG